jgi:serine/threonine protein kinase
MESLQGGVRGVTPSDADLVPWLPDFKRLADFEIVRLLGRGGMGMVYEARQISLNRVVALKVLSGGLGLTAKAVQRFRREAEAAAKLHHTNIVPVYATGEEDGTHFYAMELIEGPSLDELIRRMRGGAGGEGPIAAALVNGGGLAPELARTGPYLQGTAASSAATGAASSSLSSSLGSGSGYFDTVARMMAEVGDALEYAHQQGIVHRDMKPSNLLLSPAGRLSINDFGLARILEQPGMTMTGEFVGTPAYMSPEQISAGRAPVDHRTDVYSLGATLYELLTLQPPFTGQRRDQVLAGILHKEPEAPRKINARVPVDLETICLKALEKDPDRRYQTASAMADDLRRYVNRFAILARRAGPVQRLGKWVRRRPGVAVTLGCLVLAVCTALALAYRTYRADQLAEARLRQEQEHARAQLLEEKIRNAYLVASSGDLKRTDDAIKEIESLGASNGQVRLLRGVVAYFRQDVPSAISELEQAVKLLPESVAARALLSMSYDDGGQAEKSERFLVEMSQLAPRSAEDYLFKGYAHESNEQGGLGLADLNEGIQRRDSPVGRALRTIARANQAIDSGQRHDAEAALDDANAARGMLPDNPLVLYASLYARVVAARIYRKAQLPQERQAVLQEGDRDIQALAPFIELPNSAFAMWLFFEEKGDRDKAKDVAGRSLESSGGSMAALYSAVSLYQQAKFADGLTLLNRRRQPDLAGDVTRVFLTAELPNGPHLAFDEYQRLARAYPKEGLPMRTNGEALLFLGRKEEAVAILRRAPVLFAFSEDWRRFYEARRRFECGQLSENEYLATAGVSRWKQLHAHYQLGLFRLADGDRAAARDHFQQAVDTSGVWIYPWVWSQMFVSRLENDPKWPPWIPVKEGQAKPH